MVKKKKGKVKEKNSSGVTAPAVSFLFGVVTGYKGIPILTHGLYITLVVVALVYNFVGGC